MGPPITELNTRDLLRKIVDSRDIIILNMASNRAIPSPIPEIPEDQKLDGGICLAWPPIERKIKIALKGQGLIGYIDRTVPVLSITSPAGPPESGDNPETETSITTTVPSPTPVYSKNNE